ncbi:hypothetical protein [Thermincola ferriacetica]
MNKHRETEKKPLNKRLIREVSDNNREYCKALEMTSLNINLWLKRAGTLPDSPEEIASKYRRCLAWILSNHIVQRFHKKYGVDVIPFTIGEMLAMVWLFSHIALKRKNHEIYLGLPVGR